MSEQEHEAKGDQQADWDSNSAKSSAGQDVCFHFIEFG